MGITKAEEGLRVISVDLDSPAGKVGVRAGDLIVRIDDMTADDPAAFVKEIRAKKPGDTVTLVIHRGKLRTEVLVKLAEKPKRPRSLLTPPWRRWRRHMWPHRIPRHHPRPRDATPGDDTEKIREILKKYGGGVQPISKEKLKQYEALLGRILEERYDEDGEESDETEK